MLNRPRLQDKVVLITGASGGIGEGIARAMAIEGAVGHLEEPGDFIVTGLRW